MNSDFWLAGAEIYVSYSIFTPRYHSPAGSTTANQSEAMLENPRWLASILKWNFKSNLGS